jgi:hypothetical protein
VQRYVLTQYQALEAVLAKVLAHCPWVVPAQKHMCTHMFFAAGTPI